MPFFWHIDICKKYTSKNNKPSLRDRNPVFFTHIKNVDLHTYLKKRVSSFISCRFVNASMTLEAAMILPFFLFATISLISAMDTIKIKGCMDVALAEVGNKIAIESYSEQIKDNILPFYIKEKLDLFLKKNLSESDYKKVSHDIRITEVSTKENIFSFKVDYKIKPVFDMLGFITVKLNGKYHGYQWLGYELREEAETMVFISNTASVYHLDKNCKHLNTTIIEIVYTNIDKYRNNSREKYKECNFCDSLKIQDTVYITPEGSNYHTIKNCVGLTRSVYTVPISSIKGKRVCTGCGE